MKLIILLGICALVSVLDASLRTDEKLELLKKIIQRELGNDSGCDKKFNSVPYFVMYRTGCSRSQIPLFCFLILVCLNRKTWGSWKQQSRKGQFCWRRLRQRRRWRLHWNDWGTDSDHQRTRPKVHVSAQWMFFQKRQVQRKQYKSQNKLESQCAGRKWSTGRQTRSVIALKRKNVLQW